jgi:putative flippase GtrA
MLIDRLRAAYPYNVTFIVYFFVGGMCALIEWSVFAAVHFLAHAHYLLAATVTFLLGTYLSYLLSARVTFFSRGRSATQEVFLVYFVSALAFGVNVGTMAALMAWAGVPTMPAKIMGTGMGFFWNYGLRQFFVFHRVPPTWRQFRERMRREKRVEHV